MDGSPGSLNSPEDRGQHPLPCPQFSHVCNKVLTLLSALGLGAVAKSNSPNVHNINLIQISSDHAVRVLGLPERKAASKETQILQIPCSR